MRRQYASSVYSQKSTTSAKSGRSFLSLTTPIWPTTTTSNNNTNTSTTNDISINEAKQGVWKNLKNWIPSASSSTSSIKKKKNDTDSITTTRSSSSISKLKQLFKNKKTTSNSPRTSLDLNSREEDSVAEDASSSTTASTSMDNSLSRKSGPVGILVNSTECTAEAIAERKKRRHQRREHILKLQLHNRTIQHHHQHHFFHNQQQQQLQPQESPLESSSSDTLLTTDEQPLPNSKKMVGFNVTGGNISDDEDEYNNNNNDWGYYNPRIMFVEPSPVPRFRNVAPPPPPSPPYLNILVGESTTHDSLSIITGNEDEPTVFAQRDSLLLSNAPTMEQPLYDEEEMSLLMDSLKPKPTPKLYFNQPLYRGQIIKFSLQNAIPDDHIILFKFLTSNNNLQQQNQHEPERYFVRPSAGKLLSNQNNSQNDIVLFLNHVPTTMIKKDKIMIRWAVIQKNTQIEKWVHNLHESTRKKWIDMLDEEWPDQVTIRMTRIKIRFV